MDRSESIVSAMNLGNEMVKHSAKFHGVERGKLQGVIVDSEITVIRNHVVAPVTLRHQSQRTKPQIFDTFYHRGRKDGSLLFVHHVGVLGA